MSKLVFTPEDFKLVFSPPLGDCDLEFIANKANSRLAELLAECPVVYGEVLPDGECFQFSTIGPSTNVDTSTARLVDIKPIGEK